MSPEKGVRPDWLIGGGETGEWIRSMDWASTSLGPRAAWPQYLRTVVNLVLSCRYPMAILWGGERTLIYNNAYRFIVADHHPGALGMSIREVRSGIWDDVEPVLERVMTQGETVHLENQPFRITRSSHVDDAYFDVSYSPIYNEEGQTGGTLLVLIETTERVVLEQRLKQVNEALEAQIAEQNQVKDSLRKSEIQRRESQQIVEGILNAMPVRVFWKNRDLAYRGCNAAFARDAGFADAKDIIGKDDYQMGWRDQAELYRSDDRQVIESGCDKILIEEPQTTPEGNTITLLTSKIPLRNSIGEITGILGTYLDITERKRAEEALRESEEIFRLTFDASPDAVNINRMEDGLYVDINEGFTRVTGFTREDVIGKASLDLNIWHDSADRQKLVSRLQEMGSYENLEAVFRRKDGSLLTGLMSARVIWLRGAAHIISITRDISDRKRVDEERAKLEAQLYQAQRLESVGRLAGGVAHDFNNMLGVILGHAEMALEQVDSMQPLYEDLTEIQKAAKHSSDLTRQLLAFARKQTIVPKVVDLNEAIGGMLKMLERLIGEDILLHWQPTDNLWPVRVDPSQIDQILANLCVNARDAIAGVGKITLQTGHSTFDEAYCAAHDGFMPGEYVRFAVSDDGRGMDRETLGHIFEPFFTTKGVGVGTGLGLATVYGAVSQNGGFIHVESELGQGTRITIYLPRYVGKGLKLRTEDLERTAGQGRECILLVEDEPAILKLTMKMLEKLGYVVLGVKNPGEAIRLAREHGGEIDMLMTDVVMPEMNGRDLAKTLLSIYPSLKRLFMSGYTADVIAHNGVLDEGVHFIQKPFSAKELAAKIRSILDSE